MAQDHSPDYFAETGSLPSSCAMGHGVVRRIYRLLALGCRLAAVRKIVSYPGSCCRAGRATSAAVRDPTGRQPWKYILAWSEL